jgi:hypothetical protein
LRAVPGEQELAAAQREDVVGTEAGVQVGVFGFAERSKKKWWVHTSFFAFHLARTRPQLPLH